MNPFLQRVNKSKHADLVKLSPFLFQKSRQIHHAAEQGVITLNRIEGATMSSYVIYHYKITDRRQIDELTRLSLPVNEKYEAKVVLEVLLKQ